MPINNDGTAYSNSVYLHNMSKLGVYDSTLKLSNIKETMVNTEFIMSAYIKMDGKIIYFQENGATGTPSAVTYSQLANK